VAEARRETGAHRGSRPRHERTIRTDGSVAADPRVRARAARHVLEGRDDEAAELAAFMAIFHPEHKATAELVFEAKLKGRR